MENGVIIGLGLLLIGGLISGYTGLLLIWASDYAKYTKYEDIAHELYGRSFGIANTILILLALLASNISYTVYVSALRCYVGLKSLKDSIIDINLRNIFIAANQSPQHLEAIY